ncbi:MAG: hypothetical protein NTZ98_17570 [Acidobacteria bacterium]|nr:hypothetical protein [Acidobacteriota bacterium]
MTHYTRSGRHRAALPQQPDARQVALERHFTPKELAERWALDETTIRRLFEEEPGVLRIGKTARRDGKRDYVSLRIPESVVIHVRVERSKM